MGTLVQLHEMPELDFSWIFQNPVDFSWIFRGSNFCKTGFFMDFSWIQLSRDVDFSWIFHGSNFRERGFFMDFSWIHLKPGGFFMDFSWIFRGFPEKSSCSSWKVGMPGHEDPSMLWSRNRG